MLNIEAVKSLTKMLDVLSKEYGMALSISCYGKGKPSIFVHDNTDTSTEYLDDVYIFHCKDKEE